MPFFVWFGCAGRGFKDAAAAAACAHDKVGEDTEANMMEQDKEEEEGGWRKFLCPICKDGLQ